MATGTLLWMCLAAAAICLAALAATAILAQRAGLQAARAADAAGEAKRWYENAVQAASQSAAALNIAAESVRTAQDGMAAVRLLAETSQRAYITLDALDIVQRDAASGLPAMVRAEVRNAGRTPARAAVTCQWMRQLKDLPTEPAYDALETVVAGVLGPGSTDRVDAVGPRLDASLAQDLKRRKLVLYVYGVCRYQDLSGVERQTRWAFQWNVERQQFLRCPVHNDMT